MKNLWDLIKTKFNGLKGLAAIGFSDTIGLGISSIFWLLLPTLVDAEQYGELHYFLAIAGMGYVLSLIGTRDVITIYTSKSIKLHATLFSLSLISGTTALLVILFLFSRIDAGLLLLGFIINDLGIGYLLGKKLYRDYSTYILTQKILSLSFGLIFFFIWGIDGVLFGLAISYIHFIIIIYKGFKFSKVNLTLLKTHSGFVTNNYAMNIAGIFRNHLDKVIIAPMLGFVVLGNYCC